MATASEGKKRDTSEDVAGKGKVTAAMKKEAEAQAKKAIAEAANKTEASGLGKLRKKGGGRGGGKGKLRKSDIPYPAHIHGEDFEFYGPQGMFAEIPEDVEKTPYSADQQFVIDPEKVTNLWFTEPGRNLPKKRLYNIKAIHRDGRLSQLPFEAQINNNAGGDPADAIGMRRYERQGWHCLLDWQTMIPVYCAAYDCFAQAAQSGEFVAFCTMRHAQHTLPNQYKGGGGAVAQLGALGRDATTSKVWAS